MATIKNNLRFAGINPKAIELANKLDEAFFNDMEDALAAVNHTRVMAIFIASDINALFTPEEIAEWPIVNTNKTDDEGYEGNNPDYTKIMDGKKTTRVSFYDTMIDRSKWAVLVKSELEKVTDALAEKEGHNKSLSRQGKLFLEPEKKRLESKLRDVKNLFRKGVRIVQNRTRIEQELPGVKFEYWTNPQGEVIHSPTPIVLSCPSKTGIFEHMGVGSFLSLNVDKALATLEALDHEATAHEEYEALMATKKKGADEEEQADPDNLEVDNEKRFETAAASMLPYLRKDKTIERLYARIDKMKEVDDYADFVLTISGLSAELADMAEHFAGKIEKAREYMASKEDKVRVA